MQIDADQPNGEYPPQPECEVNTGDCSFTPVSYLCHECGIKLCADCAVGVRHQPRMFKYDGIGEGDDDRVQMHCPDCADSHGYNTTVLAAGGGASVAGLALLALATAAPVAAVPGLLLLGVGGYLLYKEVNLKAELDATDVGA